MNTTVALFVEKCPVNVALLSIWSGNVTSQSTLLFCFDLAVVKFSIGQFQHAVDIEQNYRIMNALQRPREYDVSPAIHCGAMVNHEYATCY